MLFKALHRVLLHGLRREDNSAAEDSGADVDNNPVSVRLGGPAVPEEAGGHKEDPRYHERDAVFRCGLATSFCLEAFPYAIGDACAA